MLNKYYNSIDIIFGNFFPVMFSDIYANTSSTEGRITTVSCLATMK